MRVIIIEDEPRTAKELKGFLEGLDSDISVEAILPSVASSIRWLEEHGAPDLIFSDIQLGDGLSFEIFRSVNLNTPVVFCTAYDQYAIMAFESNGINYLLKPIEEEMVAESIRKYRQMRAHMMGGNYRESLDKALDALNTNYKQSVLVHYRDKIIPIRINDICYVYASGGVVLLHTADGKDFSLQHTIDRMEAILNPSTFFRVNRQFIVSRSSIQKIAHFHNRRLQVQLLSGVPEEIIVSRLKVQDFLDWMEVAS